MKFRLKINTIYYYLLIFTIVSLPLSMFALSVAIILLFLNWLIEGGFKEKFRVLKERKSILLLVSIYLIHIIGMVYTKDLDYGLKDLRIKLPLLIFPIVIGTSKPLDFNQMKKLLYFFILAIFVSTLFSVAALLGLTKYEIVDVRHISFLVPHIRLAIMINIAIFAGSYLLMVKRKHLKKHEIYTILVAITWLAVFLIFLKSFTGMVLFILVGYVHLFYFITKFRNKIVRFAINNFLILIPLFVLVYTIIAISNFYRVNEVDFANLETTTKQGNPYKHSNRYGIENGNYIWVYVCENELREQWNKRSSFDYSGKDKRNQELKHTLIRYMTSKGLRKDAEGIAKLSNQDIHNIETGIANCIYAKKFSFYPRLYELIWEYDNYRRGGNLSGHSVTQRIEYMRVALLIWRDHLWLGTGTGDVVESFRQKYEEVDSQLTMKWRLRAHNQIITFALTFGIIGFVWIAFAFVYPIFLEKKWNNYLFVLVLVIFTLSLLNEDTLETHVGASMVAFFHSLFLLGYGNNYKKG